MGKEWEKDARIVVQGGQLMITLVKLFIVCYAVASPKFVPDKQKREGKTGSKRVIEDSSNSLPISLIYPNLASVPLFGPHLSFWKFF